MEGRSGDVTYLLGSSPQPLFIENESVRDDRVHLDANGYLAVFDTIYLVINGPDRNNPLVCDGMLVCENLLRVVPAQVHLLPLIPQQTLAGVDDNGTLVKATFGKESYTISVAQGQTQIFVSFTLSIFMWCLIITIASSIYRVPNFSSYTETDILGKVPIMDHESEDGRDLYEFHS